VFEMSGLKGKGTLLDDMRETLGAALKCLGYSLNSTIESEIEAAMELAKVWKRNVASFTNEDYKDDLASGALLLAHSYSGDVAQIAEERTDADLLFVLPEEGFSVWCDDMVIPCAAQEVALAHAFINFMLLPDVASRNMQFCYYEAPNPAAYQLLPKSLRDDPTVFVPMDLLFMGEMIRPLGAATALYERAWKNIHSE
jgi:spermidine/putrescine transport system substrate-binding protein